MCIVSFYRKGDEFILTHNRDEEINRTSSTDIIKQEKYGKTYFSPVDERSNGTWIFYSDQYIACILNGGEEKPSKMKDTYRKSRGIILINLLQYDNVKDYIRCENLMEIAPFTIFVFERNTKDSYLLHWNEENLTVKDITNEQVITWCSSTLYSIGRREEIDRIYKENYDIHPEEIKALHYQLKMNRGDLYDFLATTSISQIVMNSLRIDMKYCQLF